MPVSHNLPGARGNASLRLLLVLLVIGGKSGASFLSQKRRKRSHRTFSCTPIECSFILSPPGFTTRNAAKPRKERAPTFTGASQGGRTKVRNRRAKNCINFVDIFIYCKRLYSFEYFHYYFFLQGYVLINNRV